MKISAIYRSLALISVVSLVLASTFTGGTALADSNGADTPPGQLTRRGVSGIVAAVGSSSIVVETKHGNVTIDVDSGTIIKSRGESIGLVDIIVGDRAGVLLDRAPDATPPPSGDDSPDATPPSSGDDSPDATPPPSGDDSPDATPPPSGDDSPDATPPPSGDDSPDATPPPSGDDSPDATPPSTVDDSPVATPPPSGDDSPDATPPPSGDDSPDATPPSTGDDTTPTPTPEPTVEPSFRQNVTALRITIVPSKATRSHECVVVTSTGDGTTTVLDEDGNETELEGDEGTEGEDICLLTQTKKGGGKKVVGSVDPSSVDDRLTRLAERNEALAEKLAEKKADRETKREERLAKTVSNAPEDKKGKAQGAKDKSDNRGSSGSSGSGSSGSGSSGNGNSGSGGSSSGGGNSGNSGSGSSGNSGGGNSGNSGGGNSGNSGGGNGKK